MKIGVYGLGRFGSFFSSVLSRGEAEVIAASRSVHTPPDGVSIRPLEEVLSADYLFFAVSISSFESVLKSLADRTSREIRAGNNIEKLYLAGEFDSDV